MKQEKNLLPLWLLLLCLLLCSCGGPVAEIETATPTETEAPEEATYPWREMPGLTQLCAVSVYENATDSVYNRILFEHFDALEEQSGHTLSIQVFACPEYTADQLIQGAQNGVFDLIRLNSLDSLSQFVPQCSLLDIPGLFDVASFNALMDSGWRDILNSYFEEVGLTLLFCQANAMNDLTCCQPVYRLEQISELRIRCVSTSQCLFWQQLGAEASILPGSQLELALENGEINAHSNLPFYTNDQLPVYILRTAHQPAVAIYIMNLQRFQNLSQEQQLLLRQCMAEAAAETQANLPEYQEYLDSFVRPYEPVYQDAPAGWTEAAAQASKQVIDELRTQVGDDLADALLAQLNDAQP